MKALQAVFELLQSHYPERLHALWFLNAPFIFWGVWRMVRLLSNHLSKHLLVVESPITFIFYSCRQLQLWKASAMPIASFGGEEEAGSRI